METGKARAAGRDAALAGFQAGMVAALAMLAWLGLASVWYRRSFWTTANLMASNFYGEAALGRHSFFRSLSGLALYLIFYSLLGALFAFLVSGRAGRLRTVLLGILAGLAWYYLWWGWLWKTVNWIIALYTHDGPMLAGHVLYGALLARFPKYLPREEAPAPAPAPLPAESAPLPDEQPGAEPRP